MGGVVVSGIGLVTALGNTTQTWEKLLAGQSAIAPHQPFPDLAPRPLALIGPDPADLAGLTQQAVAAALQDAGLSTLQPDCGIVIGSSRSQQQQLEHQSQRYLQTRQPPEFWLDSLPHTPALLAARQVGSQGPLLAPMAACATGLWAIAQAMMLIESGQCDRILAGAVEAPITPLTLAGFAKMGALATTGCYPFDQQREGLVLGEGAAVLLLESPEAATARGARSYGRLLGWGFTADGHHVSAPDPEGKEAAIAISQCLQRSGLNAADISYIHAHGTSTQLNDANEAALIQHCCPQAQVSSTKGATGHTLGASGAIGVALCLLALTHKQLPPTTGLSQPAFDLNFVRVSSPLTEPLGAALCLSFGFGGQNGVVAIGG
jgi:3-oxoacyl-[acyl-carrier-protein] synthase II